MMSFDYHRPSTAEEAQRLKRSLVGARYVAGGTDLIVRLKSGAPAPSALISLRGIAALDRVTEDEDVLSIGALTPLCEVMSHPAVQARYPVVVQAVRTMGSAQIRNAATLGGNLCNASPCADSAPPLMVLGATARILGASGERDVPIGEFFRGPGQTCLEPDDILAAIRIGRPSPRGRGLFQKKVRVRMDLASVNVAVWMERAADGTCERARVVAGAVAPVPLRLEAVEQLVEAKELTAELCAEAGRLAAESVSPITDIRGSAEYRRHIVGVFVRRGLEALAREEER